MQSRQLCAVSSALLLLSLLPAMHPGSETVARETMLSASNLPRVVISEFYPRAMNKDEYFVLSSLSDLPVNLRNWSVTDGEGTLKPIVDTVIVPRKTLTVSMNGSSYQRAYGRTPDIVLDDPDIRKCLSISGTFALADSGDSLSLLDSSNLVVDCVEYGVCSDSISGWIGAPLPNLRQGEIARRASHGGVLVDTDHAADWMPFREYKYGYTDVNPLVIQIPAGRLSSFTSPDCSLDVVLQAVRSARTQVRICSYEFSSSPLTSCLIQAMDLGVQVRIIVDGSPAGGMDDRQIQCLSILASRGADVREVKGNLSLRIVQHVGAMHAKYMVVDSGRSLILSENFVESGIPEDRVFANRGWGVIIEDEAVASYLTNLFEADANQARADVLDWRLDTRYLPDASIPLPRTSNHTKGMLLPVSSVNEASVTIVPSPDGSPETPYLESFIMHSSKMKVQQFQVDLYWENRWTAAKKLNPFLSGITSCLRLGANVQMLMDSSWFNSAHNDLIANYMNSLAANESLAGTFRCLDPRCPISVVHNKGAVFDDRISLVSSNNWCDSSFARNRELGVLIDSEEIANYFSSAFELDWEPDLVGPNASAGPDLEIVLGQTAILDGCASSDDRAVIDWTWDIDSDGRTEYSGSLVSVRWDIPGTRRVVLTVQDAWGNLDTDEVVVRVLPYDGTSAGSSYGLQGPAALVIPVTGALSALGGAIFARMRTRGSRKFNHPDSD